MSNERGEAKPDSSAKPRRWVDRKFRNHGRLQLDRMASAYRSFAKGEVELANGEGLNLIGSNK